MATHRFELATELPFPAGVLWEWHTRPGALERLTPPWEPVRILERRGDLTRGTVVLEIPIGPTRQRWVARHLGGEEGVYFVDQQVEGPFTRWMHTHRFEPVGPDRCRYVDQVEYELPFGAAGEMAAGSVERRLTRSFRYRHATLAADLASHRRLQAMGPLTVLVTGASGLLGQALTAFLSTGGHRVRRLGRGAPGPDAFRWDPAQGELDPAALAGVDAVVHLAGESIAGARWSPAQRRRILESRVQGTALLAERLAALPDRPRVLVSASAVGVYGNRGDTALLETTPLHTGPDLMFVEQVGQAWEGATAAAARAGIRTVHARIGLVLTPAGGALEKMLLPFQAGVGGRMGNGRQYMSWIGIDDVVGAIHHAIGTPALSGPVNCTAPIPVTNAEFTRVLGQVLGRPAIFAVPAAALRLAVGEMADELLLASLRVIPERLRESGYTFRHAELGPALRHVLGR